MSDSEHRAVKLLSLPSIDRHFPLVFSNGMQIPQLKVACARCHTQYSLSSLHGQISKEDDSSYVIEAAAICVTCNSVAHFCIKASDDQSFSMKHEGEWLKFMQKGQAVDDQSEADEQAEPAKTKPEKRLERSYALLKILWALVYIVSVHPALNLILAGDKHDYSGFLMNNACLCVIGYACSTILAVRTSKQKTH
jgi:hypothetical protein